MNKWDSHARPDPDAEAGTRSDGTVITPIEAVIDHKSSRKLHAAAELSEQISEERAKRNSEPIHMDGLKPLPKGMPRLPSGVIPGGPGAPSMVPSVRRSIPPPFQRESISIGRHGKTWAYLRARDVEPGDLVVDFGKVASRDSRIVREEIAGRQAAVGEEIVFVNVCGELRSFAPEDEIRVFRVHEVNE